MTTAELTLTRPEPTMDRGDLRLLMDQAIRYVESGLLPASIKTPQQALIIMAQGRELGIPSTVALRQIVVVQGKPTCSAELMLALVHRTYGQSAMRVFKTDNEACTVQYRQQGWDGISEYTFSIEDAKRAGLLKNATWTQYPAAMLRARAISATVRFAFPECLSGLYLPDELGADVTVVDGEVVPLGAEPPSDSDPDRIDYNAAWHVAVRGTRFADDDMRHVFVSHHTGARFQSLSAFLEQANGEQADALVESVKDRIALEQEYTRLAALAVEKGHKDATKIRERPAADLTDGVLERSVVVLQVWERKLPAPVAPVAVDDGDEPF